MATIKNRQADRMSGKLGSKIMYTWKGRDCERAYAKPKDPMTPAQMAHRLVFGTMSSLGKAMLEVVKIGLRGKAAEGRTTEKNIFIKLNKQCFSIADDEVSIDYANLKVADGPLATVDFGEPSTVDGRTIRVAFSNREHADRFNYVMLVAYLPGKRNCMLSEPVFRSAGEAEITLPESWTGLPAHIYGFCWDGKDAASPSNYIGAVNQQ